MANNKIEDISKILSNYANSIQDAIIESADEIAQEGMTKLRNEKNTYQVRTGRYNRGWKVRKTSGDRYVNRTIYNATDYQLTHLLENGHKTRNGGSTRAFKHIAPVEEYCVKKFQNEVEEIIKRGG